MKKLVAAAALLTLSSAIACPVQAGKLGNGVMAMPSGITAECGATYKLYDRSARKNAGGVVKWTELYKGTGTKIRQIAKLLGISYKNQGFKLYKRMDDVYSKQAFYINMTTNKVVGIQTMIADGEDVLGIMGN